MVPCGSSLSDIRKTCGFPTDSRQVAHSCVCGDGPAFLVTVSQPLVGTILGPEPVCAACMPGMNNACEVLCAANRLLLVDVRAWV